MNVIKSRLLTAFVAAAFLSAAFLSVYLFVLEFPARDYVAIAPPLHNYISEPMQLSLDSTHIRRRQREVNAFGPRFMGTPGAELTADYIREKFKGAGLEVFEQALQTAAPQTAYREISLPSGEKIDEVELFPLLPNHMQPVVSGSAGVSGKLILLDREVLANRECFDDVIGLIDTDPDGPGGAISEAWVDYARLGMKAIILSHRDGLDHVPWRPYTDDHNSMATSIPVNFVRVAATPEIFAYVGREIRLRVRVDYKSVPNVSLFGLLRSPGTSTEALIIPVAYDACSPLPDRALGIMQALHPAIMLQMLEGILPYRETLRRDVVFAAFGSRFMAEDGVNNLLRVIGVRSSSAGVGLRGIALPREKDAGLGSRDSLRRADQAACFAEKIENEDRLAMLQELVGCFDNKGFLTSPEATLSELNRLSKTSRSFLEEQVSFVLNERARDLGAAVLAARISWERSSMGDPEDPALTSLHQVVRSQERASAALGHSLLNLLRYKRTYAAEVQLRDECKRRLFHLLEHHRSRAHQLQQEEYLRRLFSGYQRVGVMDVRLLPASRDHERLEVLSFESGRDEIDPASASMMSILGASRHRLGLERELSLPALRRTQRSAVNQHVVARRFPFHASEMWANFGYRVYAFYNLGRKEAHTAYIYPSDLPFMYDVESMRHSLAVVGETFLTLAHGNGSLQPGEVRAERIRSFGGRVLVSGLGQSIIPNHPFAGAIVGARSVHGAESYNRAGFNTHLFVLTDPYGRFSLPRNASDFSSWLLIEKEAGTYTPVAAGYGDDGLIAYVKDEGEEAQRVFKSVLLDINDQEGLSNMTLVLFPAASVSILDLNNPQTMQDYSGVELISASGLSPFPNLCRFSTVDIDTTFVRPDQRFYVELQSGIPENEFVRVTRAFLTGDLGEDSRFRSREISGSGFLAADHRFLLEVPQKAARSMIDLNSKRIAVQNRYGMADEQTNRYFERSRTKLKSAEQTNQPLLGARREARQSVVYSSLIHPVLRASIFEATLSILWYLALLIPFIFFAEKLIFACTDLRRQLLAQAAIFLIVFLAFRLLHPAFSMVRSGVMILLGFSIILISFSMTLLFSGRLKENFDFWQKRRGRFQGTQISSLGVFFSALILGITNMQRRKVRTWLTCSALALVTFAALSLSSVSSEVVDETVVLGKAPFQGMLIKRDMFRNFSSSEHMAIESRFGDRFDVCPRVMLVGSEGDVGMRRRNPQLEMVYRSPDRVRRLEFDSAIRFSHAEPLRDRIRFLTGNRWFTAEDARASNPRFPIFIPDRMAETLGITVPMVDAQPVMVTINGGAPGRRDLCVRLSQRPSGP